MIVLVIVIAVTVPVVVTGVIVIVAGVPDGNRSGRLALPLALAGGRGIVAHAASASSGIA